MPYLRVQRWHMWHKVMLAVRIAVLLRKSRHTTPSAPFFRAFIDFLC